MPNRVDESRYERKEGEKPPADLVKDVPSGSTVYHQSSDGRPAITIVGEGTYVIKPEAHKPVEVGQTNSYGWKRTK